MPRLREIWGVLAMMMLMAVQAQDNATATNDQDPLTVTVLTAETQEGGRDDCDKDIHPFDPLRHKRHYKLGVHAIRGVEAAMKEYNTTFEKYLTETAGRRFDPPITFSMVPTTMHGIFAELDEDNLDFLYVNPGVYSCVGVEYGAQPLATIISHVEVRGLTFDLDVFGGVIFALADNDEINDMEDLKDKVIGAGSISMIMAGQMQFYEMMRAGLSYTMDPKQVVFTHNQYEVTEGVLDGTFDVGFVRTEQIEKTTQDMDVFKVLNPKVYVMDDGSLFPFLHSTDIYPEWPIAALPHVASDVAKEVQTALLNLQAHAEVGKQIESGAAYASNRCDTTEEIAKLAWQGSTTGSLAGFRTPRSYFEVRTMHEAAGFIKKDHRGDWSCTRADTMYDSFDCPEGHYKLDPAAYDAACSNIGLECREGWDCYCKPCMKAHQVDVFECYHDDDYIHEDRHIGCDKMSVCAIIEQRQEIQFRIRDNQRRLDSEVKVEIHMGGSIEEVPVTIVDDFRYKFNWTSNHVGMGILEVEINGEQIPESPMQIAVVERDCELYYGSNMKASLDGECVCADNTVDMGGNCVSATVLAIVFSVIALMFALIGGYFLIRYKNYKNDKVWMVAVEELHFDDPVEVVGQGAFGVVLKAEYRGTKVAIKKAIRYRRRNSGSNRSRSKSPSRGSKFRNKRQSVAASDVPKKLNADKARSRSGSLDSGMSDDLSSNSTHDDQEELEFVDPEVGLPSAGRSMGKSGSLLSMSFLRGSFARHRTLNMLCCCKRHDDYHTHFKDSVLGQSQSVSKKTVAAVLCPWFNEQARKEEEFLAEMRVLSHLRHPCITTVMGAVVSRNYEPMLVMEYLEYGSLHDILRNDTMHLAGEIILQICRDVAQGLRYLHSSKPPVLHGDLKARNILIDSRFRAKLCDFGLSDKSSNLVTGTPLWMAPEYLMGKAHYNCTCDMYSVAIIFWEIYSRKSPYEGEHFRDVLRKICDRRINKRPQIDATFPPKMVDLMKKLWSADPTQRPHATSLDMTLMEMSARDAEPIEVAAEPRGQRVFDDLFPQHIAKALKAGQKVEPETHDLVTVVFSEIVGFNEMTRTLDPMKITNMMNRLFQAFDQLAKKHEVFKVETVGQNWMGVSNLENNQGDSHVKRVAMFAIDMVNEASKTLLDEEAPEKGCVSVRAGFHSGSVVTNVIGSLNPRYGLFGDTVNTASRMETNAKINRILCSEYSHGLLKEQAPELPTRKRGRIQVKGKGQMTVYWVGDGLLAGGKRGHDAAPEQRPPDCKKVEFDVDDSSSPAMAEALPEMPSFQPVELPLEDNDDEEQAEEPVEALIETDLPPPPVQHLSLPRL